WLTEPDWGPADVRSDFIKSLDGVQAPELFPGLTWVVENDEDQDTRDAAAEALAKYRDQRAIPALRRALEKEKNEYSRETLVAALAECGGFSDDEMAEAIEAYATMVVTEDGEQQITKAKAGSSQQPLPLNISIGRVLSKQEKIRATEGLALKLIERAKSLR